MTQDNCLSLPHHWTHMGVCYPGSNAHVQIQSANPLPHCNVPEPSIAGLFVIAFAVWLAFTIRPRWHFQ